MNRLRTHSLFRGLIACALIAAWPLVATASGGATITSIEQLARYELDEAMAATQTAEGSRAAAPEAQGLRSAGEKTVLAPVYRCLPTCTDDDGRFLGVAAGASLDTLSEENLDLQLAVAAGTASFEIGIFDGDADSANGNWDVGSSSFTYTLFEDSARDGTDMTVAAGPFTSAAMPNNDWFSFTVTPGAGAVTPSGNFFYRLRIENQTPAATVLNSFKVRSTGVTTIEIQQQPFGFYAALQSFSDAGIIFPDFPDYDPLAGPGDFGFSTYDGTFDFYLDVISEEPDLVIWGGDLDRGKYDGTDLDTDDPDTPNACPDPAFPVLCAGQPAGPYLPSWATFDTVAEGVAVGLGGAIGVGEPPDDNNPANLGVYLVRAPSIEFSVIAPDGGVYDNFNPSGNQEWEQYRLTTDPFDPQLADELVPALPAGTYRVNARGVDMQNLNFWRFFHPLLCVDDEGVPCTPLRPFLIGDLVWFDADGNGVQNGGEPGAEGVVVELLDDDGDVVATTLTGAGGDYLFNVLEGQYTVRIAASNFAAGGVLAGYASTTGGETQGSTIVDDNDLERDFGYRGTGSIGNYVWYDANGDAIDNEPAYLGLGGITLRLVEAGSDGLFDTPDDVDYGTQVTDSAGAYDFTSLPPGLYRVDVVDSTVPVELVSTTLNDPLVVPLGPGENFDDADFGYIACDECSGKVSALTFQYLGASSELVEITDKYGVITLFSGVVAPGELISIQGFKDDGTMENDIKVSIGGQPHVGIHTSCSKPIGPGLRFGDLLVVAGSSRDGGPLCRRPDCDECEGKVTFLTLQYQGASTQPVEIVGKDDEVLFSGLVAPGGLIDIAGNDSDLTFANEIEVFVAGQLHTMIHTSCSQPIGPGFEFGDFLVVAGQSRFGGLLCPKPECQECDGGVTSLTLEYEGTSPAQVEVHDGSDVLFSGTVSPGDTFTFVGTASDNKMGSNIELFVDGALHAEIHTSCSQPIGPGRSFGDFLVVDGSSVKGGKLCPLPECQECDGGVTSLTLEYEGTSPAQVEVHDGSDVLFSGTVSPGGTFTFVGTASDGKMGSNIEVFVDGALHAEIHTSCSQPIGPGRSFGDFRVVDGTSVNGGKLCPLPDCQECDGGVRSLTLQYLGSSTELVEVTDKDAEILLFSGMVGTNGLVVFDGFKDDGTMGSEIKIFVGGQLHAEPHTSCSQPIGPLVLFGDFVVLAGQSRDGGDLCPIYPDPPPPPGPDCLDCDGGVTSLSIDYLGATSTLIEVKAGSVVMFSATVDPGGAIAFDGFKDDGTMGSEIELFADGQLRAKIHTSCSQPIGPGLVIAGDFVVTGGTSRDGGNLCPVPECAECDGKVTALTLEYQGPSGALVEITGKDGSPLLFSGIVSPGELIDVRGYDNDATLDSEISVYVDGAPYLDIHTSCSQPIAPGLAFGDFLVVAATSRKGGAICPIPECSECDGKVTRLTFEYQGAASELVEIFDKDDHVLLFSGFLAPGEIFEIRGFDDDLTLGTEIKVYVGGALDSEIHTSCSQPIEPGFVFGALRILAGRSRFGGPLCPVIDFGDDDDGDSGSG